jgi:type VI secretion system protein ImpB
MAKQPTPKIKERVKVQILPSSEAKESVELDYRMFVTGNFSHQEPGAHRDGDGTLKDRRVREIKNKRDFKTVLEDLNPKLNITVPNKLTEEKGSEMEVNLDVKDMKDFHPDEIAKKVEPLQQLLEARERLKQLKMQVLRDVKLRKAIEGVLKEGGGSLDDLMKKLGPAEEKKEKKEK